MRLSIGQHLQQKQVQTLAPRMIQSMEILQLPIIALQERIDQELAENPLLEIQEEDPNIPDPKDDDEKVSPDAPDLDQREIVVDESHNNAEDFERLLDLDRDIPDYFDNGSMPSSNRIQESIERKHDTMANIAERPESLHVHLLGQLGEMDMDEPLYRMCERIISTLSAEDGGYLKVDLMDLLPPGADSSQLELAQQALDIVQNLDPLGVAARNLRECLLLQIMPGMPYYEELRTLVSSHLEDLSHNRLPMIQKATGYSIETIQHAWEQLKKLNPKPASEYIDYHIQTVTPDVFVDQEENGEYKVRLEDGGLPPLYISNYYRRRLESGDATPEEREYIKRKVNAAQWLIESIEQRRSTLTRVSQAIVDHQRKFLDDGPEAIEPLKMQQIADKVGVHVTTVSRAVDDKWIQTPRGIFPLKRFFVGGTRSDAGEDVAWDKIRIRLQDLVDHEDKSKPLSDDEIVRRLKSDGLNVARRTVTKYRKKMGIPSSRQRRDWSGA